MSIHGPKPKIQYTPGITNRNKIIKKVVPSVDVLNAEQNTEEKQNIMAPLTGKTPGKSGRPPKMTPRHKKAIQRVASLEKRVKNQEEQLNSYKAKLVELNIPLDLAKELSSDDQNISDDSNTNSDENHTSISAAESPASPSLVRRFINNMASVIKPILRPSVVTSALTAAAHYAAVARLAALGRVAFFAVTRFSPIATAFAIFSSVALVIEGLSKLRQRFASKALDAWEGEPQYQTEYNPFYEAGKKAEGSWKDYVFAPLSSWLPSFASAKSMAFQAGRETVRSDNEIKEANNSLKP